MKCMLCDEIGGPLVECKTCRMRKKPVGRDAPMEMASGLCDSDCSGYAEEPNPGQLWPGERYGDSLGHMDWHWGDP